MTRLATVLLIVAGIAGLAVLVGADVELSRFGWEPPVILTGAVLTYLSYSAGSELGDRAEQYDPTPEPVNESEPLFPDPRA